MPKRDWIPETDEEWRQLDEQRMREQRRRRAQDDGKLPFRYVVLLALAMYCLCRIVLFPAWDQQMDDLFKQQQEAAHAKCKALGECK